MEILQINNKRILLKENYNNVIINDNEYIEYTGKYYFEVMNEDNTLKEFKAVDYPFVGRVITDKYHIDYGIMGFYVIPLYIFINNEWIKISNYEEPSEKYFYYPHLLVIPKFIEKYHFHLPIPLTDSCKNVNINEFLSLKNINDSITLFNKFTHS